MSLKIQIVALIAA
ncbi:hypothetical protein GWI33_009904, partial [Rhynchophorus ferrugineus]